MQNYAYNRNAMLNKSVIGYRSTEVRRPRNSAGRMIFRLLLKVLLSETAILTYKIFASLFAVALVLGAVGAAESGLLPVSAVFSVCLIVMSSACYIVYRKYGLDG